MLMHQTWHIALPGYCRTAPNLANKKLHQIYCVCLRIRKHISLISLLTLKILLIFFVNLTNLLLTFSKQHPYFLFTFILLWPFSWPFWTSFTSHVQQIPCCAQNSATLMRWVRHKHGTPKFSAQPHYYAGHFLHQVYFFQSGLMASWWSLMVF